MRTNQIGNTDVYVTSVSLGCGSLGNLYRAISDEQAREVLDCAWSNGIRYFDTAPRYGRGRSEMRLGKFFQNKNREDYVLSTKVGRILSPRGSDDPIQQEADGFADPLQNNVRYDYSGDGIVETFEQSCERLGSGKIDIIFVHDIGIHTHGETENGRHMDDFLGSGFDALKRLKSQGRIGAIGLGVNENEICLDIMEQVSIDVILLAGRLTILDRSAEDALVAKCRDQGTSLVLGGIFNSGILATGPIEGANYDYGPAPAEVLERVATLQESAKRVGLSLPSAALHYAHRHPNAASVLIGTSNPATLQKNMDALNEPVREESLGDLFDYN
ncbi:MAG: aldo/keto reductase [Stappiaceae bacterium]